MKRKKILVCDDDQEILDIMSALLERAEFDIITLSSGTGLDELLTLHRPDLVLLDIWMPDISGTLLLASLRSHPDSHSVPVIMMSAGPEGKEIAEAAGATAFITKPFDNQTLEKLIRENISR